MVLEEPWFIGLVAGLAALIVVLICILVIFCTLWARYLRHYIYLHLFVLTPCWVYFHVPSGSMLLILLMVLGLSHMTVGPCVSSKDLDQSVW